MKCSSDIYRTPGAGRVEHKLKWKTNVYIVASFCGSSGTTVQLINKLERQYGDDHEDLIEVDYTDDRAT